MTKSQRPQVFIEKIMPVKLLTTGILRTRGEILITELSLGAYGCLSSLRVGCAFEILIGG